MRTARVRRPADAGGDLDLVEHALEVLLGRLGFARGSRSAARPRSIRAYAAITARRGSRSARRSSSVSARTSASTPQPGSRAPAPWRRADPGREPERDAGDGEQRNDRDDGPDGELGGVPGRLFLPPAPPWPKSGGAVRPARLGSPRSRGRTARARRSREAATRSTAAGRAVTARAPSGSYRRNHVSATATNTAHSTIITRKRLKAVSTKPSEGRRTLLLPVGTEPVEATATTATRTTTARAIASVGTVDRPAAARYRPCPMRRATDSERWPRPTVVGIVNVTPDSFSDGGAYVDAGAAADAAEAMPGRRGRPRRRRGVNRRDRERRRLPRRGARRVVPVLERLEGRRVSIDTSRAEVARRDWRSGPSWSTT